MALEKTETACIPTSGGVYRLHLSETHFYVGRAKNLALRIRHHFNSLRRVAHKNRYMQNVFNQHGIFEVASFEVIEGAVNQVLRERELLAKVHGSEGCLNLSDRAEGGCRTGPLSAETRRRISESKKGTVVLPETRALLSALRRGVKKSPEHNLKNSQAHLGVRHSAERRQKESSAQKGKIISDEHRQKISKALQGTKRGTPSPETREKISSALKTRNSRGVTP